MTYTKFPVPIAGPSYQSRSRPVSSQVTSNFYQEADENNRDKFVLHSWPGQKLHASGAGADRGQCMMSGVKYWVAGTFLYSVDSFGNKTNLGVIDGNDRCTFANDGENMFIVNAGFVQQYNRTTNALTSVTDPDIVGAVAVDFLNNQFIYTKPDLFVISDVGDGSSASGLNAAQAESQPDDLLRAYVFDQVVYMFGESSIEPWYNSGTGSPPFARIDTQIISVGTGAIHSISNNDNFVYWLGDDRQVYRASGGRSERVTSKAIAGAIEGYTTISDAIGSTITMQGQNFYILTFPAANKTWALNESLGAVLGWFELSNDRALGKYNCTSFLYDNTNGKTYCADESAGNMYELDLDTFTNNGREIRRVRVLPPIHSGLVSAPGQRITMSRFTLIVDQGVGLVTGQGDDPKIMIEASYDGGKSFEDGTWMDVGRQGLSQLELFWDNTLSFFDLVIRISTTDPVHYTIISASIDAKIGGK